MEKAPGLLEEHGGQIKLKLTWAMKLVTRISERQKEIEFGLPAGTIANMTSTFCSGYNYGSLLQQFQIFILNFFFSLISIIIVVYIS